MADKRRISEKDWESVAEFVSKQHKERQGSKYRKRAERIWKEVDRQVYMESMQRSKRNPHAKGDWRSALELGELSRASEILSADIRRMGFPQNRNWFDPHAKIPGELNTDSGESVIDQRVQKRIDNQIRALMSQQHLDFGFKARQDLSIKEALHHGGYVVEVAEESMLGAQPDGMIKQTTSPTWVPHSMWNCYPDPSASVMATNLFYSGSMIIVQSMLHSKLIRMRGEGWIPKNLIKLDKPTQDKDKDIIKYFGDITIPRKNGKDIYLPNVEVRIVDKKVVYYKPNNLPYSRIIYNGYERLDVRDPYYISPLVKMAPTQKIASVLANKFIDGIDLKTEKPIVYDGNDPDLVASGGPEISPGSKTPTKNMANFKEMDVGDPGAALTGLQFAIAELQKGTGVDSIRSGMSAGTEQTATEVERTRQGGQIRTVDFLDKHELQGLRPFLYLQYELNKQNLKNYEFYNPSMDAPDYESLSKADLPKSVTFDVVGSKGMIEEQQRQQNTMLVTEFMFEIGAGDRINIDELVKEMYQDAGNKNPERFLNLPDDENLRQQLEQAAMQIQQFEQALQQLQQENQKLQMQEQSRITDMEVKGQIEGAKAQNDQMAIELKAQVEQETNRYKIDRQMELEFNKAQNERDLEAQKLENEQELNLFEVYLRNFADSKASEEENQKAESDKATESQNMSAMLDAFRESMQEFTKAVTAPKVAIRGEDDLISRVITEKPKLDS